MACLRVRGSVETLFKAKAQPVPRPQTGLSLRDRRVSNAEAPRERVSSVCGDGVEMTASAAGCGVAEALTCSDLGGGGGAGRGCDSVVWARKLDAWSVPKTSATRKLKSGG
eukprot:3932527-Pleurochrysis_carterae.AAC.1